MPRLGSKSVDINKTWKIVSDNTANTADPGLAMDVDVAYMLEPENGKWARFCEVVDGDSAPTTNKDGSIVYLHRDEYYYTHRTGLSLYVLGADDNMLVNIVEAE